jgi:hypothetical protein
LSGNAIPAPVPGTDEGQDRRPNSLSSCLELSRQTVLSGVTG